MRGFWILYRRELVQYFTTPFAYLVGFGIVILCAILFNNHLVVSVNVSPANPALLPNFLSFALVFFAPLLTMRLLAEESREGTLELLLTAPVGDGEIVVGKFFGAWTFMTFLLAITYSFQFVLASFTNPDIGTATAAYLGIWLYSGATISVGLLFSALTENQIIAAFLSSTTLLVLWLSEYVGQVVSNIEIARVIRALTLPGHISSSFMAGTVRAEDLVYYAGLITIMLFVTIRVIESRRWR